ncbi:MAG TPA: family 43 glycosylhydrolase [Longimicrobiaceae bacterium]|nr:family 43 glycosylhydrolase [Longimicrobiaceae bacterium]
MSGHPHSRPRALAVTLLTAALAAACGAPARAPEPGPAPAPSAAEVAPASTFANPLDLDYRFMTTLPSRRAAADPVITLYKGDYYLFATTSGGYWYSPDMRHWTLVVPHGLPLENPAPSVLVDGDRLYYTAHKAGAIYATDDPKGGEWHEVAKLGSYADPMLFRDDDGRVYLYYGSSLNGSIHAVELDPAHDFRVIGGPYTLLTADYADHGWERSGPDNLGAAGMREGFRIAPYVEGSWMTKHEGTYYLQYSAPGTIWKTYADGVYTSKSPIGPFTYAPYSPFSYKPGGFVGGAGHAGTFRDKQGNYWRVVTMVISVKHKFERRLGLFPAGFDADGVMRANTYLGDYPQYLPGVASDPLDHDLVGWMLLSGGKRATASSTLDGHRVGLAFDEDIRTQWSARTGAPGEWLQVDLGAPSHIYALQVDFGEQDTRALGRDSSVYEQYVVEASDDGTHWSTLVDRSRGTTDAPHAYVQLDQPRTARYVKITNRHTAGGGKFAIRGLRVFGLGPGALPAEVAKLTVRRNPADGRDAVLRWAPAAGAQRYVVRYGIAPDKLYSSYSVGEATRLELHSLNRGVTYYFTVDAVNERGVTRGTGVRKAADGPAR